MYLLDFQRGRLALLVDLVANVAQYALGQDWLDIEDHAASALGQRCGSIVTHGGYGIIRDG